MKIWFGLNYNLKPLLLKQYVLNFVAQLFRDVFQTLLSLAFECKHHAKAISRLLN